jgi:DNA-binding transcriptional MerR regulator
MQIRQISAALDAKLAQLDQQLKQLEEQHQQGNASDPQLIDDIAALHQIRDKLLKSKDIAWRAHQLRDNGDEQRRARQRISGLFLCGLSLVGAVALIYVALQ